MIYSIKLKEGCKPPHKFNFLTEETSNKQINNLYKKLKKKPSSLN